MNARHWRPAAATPLNGPRSIAAKPSSMLARARASWQHPHTPAGSSANIRKSQTNPTELWSSVVTRSIHGFEEFTLLLIMAHFAVGTLVILFGW